MIQYFDSLCKDIKRNGVSTLLPSEMYGLSIGQGLTLSPMEYNKVFFLKRYILSSVYKKVLLRSYDHVYICLFVNIEIKTLDWHIQQSDVSVFDISVYSSVG